MILTDLLPSFLLTFGRLTAYFLTAPIFSLRSVPNTFKIGLAFFLAVLVFGTNYTKMEIGLDWQFLLLFLKELVIGILLGFISSMFIYAVQMAGSLIDLQMGFAIANVIDPQTGAQVPLMGNFKYIVAVLFLLATDGHLMMMRGILNSFFLIPPDRWLPLHSGNFPETLIRVLTESFVIAIQIAVPIVASLFLADVALGVVARTVPQLNVFVVGIPLKILVSFFILLFALPAFFYLLKLLFAEMFQSLDLLLQDLVVQG